MATEVLRVVNEEIYSRPQLYKQGVRDLTKIVTLPSNNFDAIDDKVRVTGAQAAIIFLTPSLTVACRLLRCYCI